MTLETRLGRDVVAILEGHSVLDGALIPGDSTIVVTSNDPAVATCADFVLPPEGAVSLNARITVLATGATDFHVVVTTPDGTFESTATLIVEATTVVGLVSVSLTLEHPVVEHR